MTRNRYLPLLLVLLVAGTGCGRKETGSGGAPVTAAIVQGVTVTPVAPVSLPETIELSGTVRARTSAAVAARVAGSITLLRVREGDRVQKGELLARLEAAENLASAAGAAAGVDEAERSLDEAVARKKLADATFERYQRGCSTSRRSPARSSTSGRRRRNWPPRGSPGPKPG